MFRHPVQWRGPAFDIDAAVTDQQMRPRGQWQHDTLMQRHRNALVVTTLGNILGGDVVADSANLPGAIDIPTRDQRRYGRPECVHPLP
ncbi:hypothetical protein WM40_01550 [Robbsia andropogonis]|uniref:Uncharacterized protein n=2 Tax=Robbsia andropogonis TaxID=28092 RepID=A0A0F5K5U5_9BURK|nr:hypothetical protein WM40_01550 [Robbsia andropogonis]